METEISSDSTEHAKSGGDCHKWVNGTADAKGDEIKVDESSELEDKIKRLEVDDKGDFDEQELKFDEVNLCDSAKQKIEEISTALLKTSGSEDLRELAISEWGLVTDDVRRKVWPKLLGIDESAATVPSTQEELESHKEYQQVVLDVNRSLKRFPPGIPYNQRVALQDQLTRLIMRVIIKYPHLRYYQGYHDVAVTFLLVVGEDLAFLIMEKLSTCHLKDCMEPTMEKTSFLLNYIYPLIHKLHPKLHDYMERSEVGTMFCLPWFLTWYGHNLNQYRDVVRLYDFFLSSPPLMPLYLAAVLVVHRKDEIFGVECDMANIHSLLSQIPDDLPFEELLKQSSELYERFPPNSIESEVVERSQKEFQVPRRMAPVPRGHRAVYRNLGIFRQWVDWYRPQFAGAVQVIARQRYTYYGVAFVVGVLAYLHMAEAVDLNNLSSFR